MLEEDMLQDPARYGGATKILIMPETLMEKIFTYGYLPRRVWEHREVVEQS